MLFQNVLKLLWIEGKIQVRRMGDLVDVVPDAPHFSYGAFKDLTVNGGTSFRSWRCPAKTASA